MYIWENFEIAGANHRRSSQIADVKHLADNFIDPLFVLIKKF